MKTKFRNVQTAIRHSLRNGHVLPVYESPTPLQALPIQTYITDYGHALFAYYNQPQLAITPNTLHICHLDDRRDLNSAYRVRIVDGRAFYMWPEGHMKISPIVEMTNGTGGRSSEGLCNWAGLNTRLLPQTNTTFKTLFIGLLASLFMLLSFQPAFAQQTNKQKKDQLQQQMKKLQDEIKTIEAAIKKTDANKEKNMGEILSLQAKIRSREKLIKNFSSQIDDLDETIQQTEGDIENKSAQVEKMKLDYAGMLRKTYESLSLQNQAAFILSSTSFYDAIVRYNYLLKVAEYRREQAKSIQKAIGELQEKKDDLQESKEEKVGLLKKQTAQKTDLEKEKHEKDAAIAVLQEKEKKLTTRAVEKNKAVQQLNHKIQAIIEEEIRLAKKKAEDLAKKNKNNTTSVSVNKKTKETMPLTPAEQALSNDFSSNKGKLPWPVDRGHIVGQFGKHPHAVLKGVMVENNGVDIKTVAGAQARAVFGGTVVSVFFLPTTQNCIIVKHGEYFTVYSNIETVTVKANQIITVKQSLGTLHTDKNEDLTKVHLEIWRGKDKLDPELWLAGN